MLFIIPGWGLKGPQELSFAQNRTLSQSQTSGIIVHLFEVFQPGRYIYAGEVELAGAPYQEEQPDNQGQLRPVWMFPVRLKAGGIRPLPTIGAIHCLEQIKEKALKGYSEAKLKQLGYKGRSKPAKRPAHADDCCGLCEKDGKWEVRLMPKASTLRKRW